MPEGTILQLVVPDAPRRLPTLAYFAVFVCALAEGSDSAHFVNATLEAGLDHTQWVVPATDTDAIQHMSGGAAAADYDGDGWVDLFFTRTEATDLLYRNRGDGTFEDVSASAGFTQVLNTNGATWGDIDNDGDSDLYVTTLVDGSRRNHLYINDGEGGFVEDAVARGAALTSSQFVNGFSSTFGDYDGDGYLDLFTTEWNTAPGFGNTRLMRNLGAASPGHFIDVTLAAGVDVSAGSPAGRSFAFAPSFVDVDTDGHVDLVVAADFGGSRLFWNNGDGTFTNGTVSAGLGSDENGMGSAIGDYNGDGYLDWFVSSIYEGGGACGGAQVCGWGDSGNRLFRNNGDRTFTDATDAAGVREGGWGWGSAFIDYDNDGDLDLTHTNGVDFPDDADDLPFVDDQTRFWVNDGGVFTDVATQVGVTDVDSGKGLLTFDYDRDGDLDLLVVNTADEPVLYRNEVGNQNAWLRVEAVGAVSNADGVGAQITVTPDETLPQGVQYQEINAGSHYLGQSETTAHFGLGDHAGTVDLVRVEWPASGVVQLLRDVDSNAVLTVVEPLPGDFNADGIVDASDYTVWRDELGQIGIGLLADVDGNGIVDGADYSLWAENYGVTTITAAVVPEPAGWLLFASILLTPHREVWCGGGVVSARRRLAELW